MRLSFLLMLVEGAAAEGVEPLPPGAVPAAPAVPEADGRAAPSKASRSRCGARAARQCPHVEDDEHGPMVKLIILLLCWGLAGFSCPRAPPCGQILCSLAVKILAVATQVPKGTEFESHWWRKSFWDNVGCTF